jgi:hypothetical protein
MTIKKKNISQEKHIKNIEILIPPSFWEQSVIYDLNWVYFRRKIISFNHLLNVCIQYPLLIIYFHLKIIWYKYCIKFNEVFNNG